MMMGNVKIPNTWNSVAKRIGGLLGSWEDAAGELSSFQWHPGTTLEGAPLCRAESTPETSEIT